MSSITEEVKKNLYQRCMCCLENENLLDMWAEHLNEDGEIVVYGDLLRECYEFPWIEPEEHSVQICEKCIERLKSSLSFRRDILAAKEVMDKLIEEHTKQLEIKVEVLYEPTEGNVKNMKQEDETLQEEQLDTEGEEMFEESLLDEKHTEMLYETDDDDEEYAPDDTEMEIEYLEEDAEAAGTATSSAKRKWPKKKKKADRIKAYKQYSQEDLELAMKAVMCNKMTRTEAAETYSVPVKTLGFKIRQKEMDETAGDEAMDKDQIKQKHVPKYIKHYENIQSILLCSNATPIKGHWGVGYGCCFCEEQFIDPKELKTHTLNNHDDDETKAEFMIGKSSSDFCVKLDITDLLCVLCDKSVESLEELLDHIPTEHFVNVHKDIPNQIVPFKFESNRLKCAVCNKEFEFFKLLNEHMNEHYSNFKCETCDRTFINYTSLRVHSYRHKGGEFSCNFCTKLFMTKARKSSHERVVHKLESKAYRCGYCYKRFSDGVSKKKHENLQHGVEMKTFKCEACEAKFSRLSSLKHHTQSYHLLNLPHVCPLCAKGFSFKRDLDRHVNTHTRVKQFQCDLCTKAFTREDYLKYHVKRKHESGDLSDV